MMCDSKPSPEMTTRFCVSVEQMVPYLENLCKVDEEDGVDVGDDLTESDNDNGLPIPIVEHVPNEIEPPLITDDPVTYIDISMLNPIVEAYACLQKDQLNEEGILIVVTMCCRYIIANHMRYTLIDF